MCPRFVVTAVNGGDVTRLFSNGVIPGRAEPGKAAEEASSAVGQEVLGALPGTAAEGAGERCH